MENSEIKIKALLGPTNTGKTYLAIEEMLKHDLWYIWATVKTFSKRSL